MGIKLDEKSVIKNVLHKRSEELYFELGELFIDKGIASRDYSKLEELYHLASDNEKLQPEWRKLNAKTINKLQSEIDEWRRLSRSAVTFMREQWSTPNEETDSYVVDEYHEVMDWYSKLVKA